MIARFDRFLSQPATGRRLTRLGRIGGMAAATLLAYIGFLIVTMPTIGDLRLARVAQPTQILAADGKLLDSFAVQQRERVTLEQISPHVIEALIATEDHRFYQHHGVDFRGTAAAIVHTARGDTQGGSTITQQLARNLFPDEIGRSRNLNRKVKEIITAFNIERTYSKREILETYLNTVPFLYNVYGIELAARTYFDKSAADLNLLESATLVGMLKGTSYYNPVTNPERSVKRRNVVLAQMVKRGKLSEAEFKKLQRKPLRVHFSRQVGPRRGRRPFRRLDPQVADRLGRPQRLRPVRRRPDGADHARPRLAGSGDAGGGAADGGAAEHRRRRMGREFGGTDFRLAGDLRADAAAHRAVQGLLDGASGAGRRLHPRNAGIPQGAG